MNRRNLVVMTGAVALTAFTGATVAYRNDQANRARIVAAARADAMVRGHSPIVGPPNAPVTIVEFFDPSCEACRAFYGPIKQILAMFPKEVRLVLRYAALHQGSDLAIQILEAARLQGKFEPVLEALLVYQPEWADHDQPDIGKAWSRAREAGLDVERAKRDVASPTIEAALRADMADGKTLEISGTPTIFVNAKPLVQMGPRQLYEMVVADVEKSRK